jgi:hypothetical protein
MAVIRQFPANWTQTLARVDEWLGAAIASVEQREASLAALPAVTPAVLPDLADSSKQATALANRPARLDLVINPADAELRACEDALRQWITRADATRRKLAEWAARA